MLAAGLVPMGIVGKSFRRDAELPAHIGKHRAGREFARFTRAARPSHIEQEHRKAEPSGIAAAATDTLQIVAGPRTMTHNLSLIEPPVIMPQVASAPSRHRRVPYV